MEKEEEDYIKKINKYNKGINNVFKKTIEDEKERITKDIDKSKSNPIDSDIDKSKSNSIDSDIDDYKTNSIDSNAEEKMNKIYYQNKSFLKEVDDFLGKLNINEDLKDYENKKSEFESECETYKNNKDKNEKEINEKLKNINFDALNKFIDFSIKPK